MRIYLLFLVLIATLSCKNKNEYAEIKAKKSNLIYHEVKSLEHIDVAEYVYVKVEEKGSVYWLAAPLMTIEDNLNYFYSNGMVMHNFESKELQKTFDKIVFVDKLSTNKDELNSTLENHPTSTEPTMSVKIKIPKNGVSVAEIFKNKNSLKGKELLVRGIVTKVNKEILDKNWIHIADGSVYENKKSITVTTTEIAKVGDTLTVKGVLTLDKDFGFGYVYDVLLEEGTIIKE